MSHTKYLWTFDREITQDEADQYGFDTREAPTGSYSLSDLYLRKAENAYLDLGGGAGGAYDRTGDVDDDDILLAAAWVLHERIEQVPGDSMTAATGPEPHLMAESYSDSVTFERSYQRILTTVARRRAKDEEAP